MIALAKDLQIVLNSRSTKRADTKYENSTRMQHHNTKLGQRQRATLDFSLLLKNHFVSSECSLQSSNVCFEVRSEYSR